MTRELELQEVKKVEKHNSILQGEIEFIPMRGLDGWYRFDFVKNIDQAALARCLSLLNEAGLDLASDNNRAALKQVTNNLVKLEAGLVALNKSTLSAKQKQIVFNSMIASPYYAEDTVTLAEWVQKIEGDFENIFFDIKRAICIHSYAEPSTDCSKYFCEKVLKVLDSHKLLTPEHKKKWFDCIVSMKRPSDVDKAMDVYLYLNGSGIFDGSVGEINLNLYRDGVIKTNRIAQFYDAIGYCYLGHPPIKQAVFELLSMNYKIADIIRALRENKLLESDKGYNNLARLKSIGTNLGLAEHVTWLCHWLQQAEPNCLTQDNIEIVLAALEDPVKKEQLFVAIKVIKLAERTAVASDKQGFFMHVMKRLNILVETGKAEVKELKRPTATIGKGESSSPSKQAVDKSLAKIKEQNNAELRLAEKYIKSADGSNIWRHAQKCIRNGRVDAFLYHLNDRRNIFLSDLLVKWKSMPVKDKEEWAFLHFYPIPQEVPNRRSSYLILAVESRQFEIVRAILEFYSRVAPSAKKFIEAESLEWTDNTCCGFGSALQQAIITKNVDLVRLLVAHGFSPNNKELPIGKVCDGKEYDNSSRSLLYIAAEQWRVSGRSECREIFQALLQSHCLIKSIDPKERETIHWAVRELIPEPACAPRGRMGFLPPVVESSDASASKGDSKGVQKELDKASPVAI